MIDLAFPILFMLLVVIGEMLVVRWHRHESVNWHDVMFNLNSGHLMLWLFRGLEITCYSYVVTHFSLSLFESWSPTLVWVFALFAWDFSFYWLHRAHHFLRVLWAVHVVHHQGEHFNLSLGVRNSWYSSLTSIPFFLLLAVLGIPLTVFVTVSILHYTLQLFNHGALTPKLGFLESVLVTPAHHRVHHVKDMAYSNKNFGGSFIFWDKLFGTFCPSLPRAPFDYGVSGAKPSANPFWASNAPLLRYFRLPVTLSDKVGRWPCSNLTAFSGALLVFAGVIAYVYEYGYGYSNVRWPQVTLFTLLALAPVALAGMVQGRVWSVMIWGGITLGLPLLFLGLLGWSQAYWQVVLVSLGAHGVAVLWSCSRRRSDAPVAMEQPHG
jgi:sterol desaturase/sphingolipid hydroxylase (fatty acid hydroxylase superfamily)